MAARFQLHGFPSHIGLPILLFTVTLAGGAAHATDGEVLSHGKISDTEGDFAGTLDDGDLFGHALTCMGDLDGDGVEDLAVGAYQDDDGSALPDANRGAVWILFLNADGTVKSHQKISDTEGGFTGVLDDADIFGSAVAYLGDLDGDEIGDLIVGAQGKNDGGLNTGAVWILFLNSDGTVKGQQEISNSQGGFNGVLDQGDNFGTSTASMGDIDGDNVQDVAVGAFGDDDGDTEQGAVWILFLNSDGTVRAHQKISDTEGNFMGELDDTDSFGTEVAGIDDLNGDGLSDMAVGAVFDDDGGPDRGAVWILFLDGQICPSGIPDPAAGLRFALAQNHPNPFYPSTRIEFALDGETMVNLSIFDVTGRRVRTIVNRMMDPGVHFRVWDGRNDDGDRVQSGTYFYNLEAGGRSRARSAVLLR